MINLLSNKVINLLDQNNSKLLNEDDFYKVFLKDLNKASSEVIIESPYITTKRLTTLLPTLTKLKSHHIRLIISTKDPIELDDYLAKQSTESIAKLLSLGIQVIYIKQLHRKLAIIDRNILYEGSLNILSQSNSKEIMRRIISTKLSWQIIRFNGLDEMIG